MKLLDAVKAFDGMHVAVLRVAADAYNRQDARLLTELCGSEVGGHRIAATWVFKALCETGRSDQTLAQACFATLENAPWEAALHLLQSVQHVPDATPDLEQIRPYLDHPKTLVSVWALDAFARSAATDEAQTEARRLVSKALETDKASLRARARQLAPLVGL